MYEPFAPLPGTLYRDEFGREAVTVDFTPDPDQRVLSAIESGRYTHTTIAEDDGRRLAIVAGKFRLHGVTQSPDLKDALKVYSAVEGLRHLPMLPDVSITPAKDIDTVVASVVEHETKAAATAVVRDRLLPAAVRRLGYAVYDMMPATLTQLEAAYAEAGKRFTATYSHIAGIDSVAAAATADKTGDTVKAWWDAKAAVAEMIAIIEMILSVDVHPDGSSRPRRDNPFRYYTLHADVAAGDIRPFMAATGMWANNEVFATDDRVTPPMFPLGIYPHIVETGVPLTLPRDRGEWEDRADAYEDLRDEINFGMFR